jgi:hypothetical protein
LNSKVFLDTIFRLAMPQTSAAEPVIRCPMCDKRDVVPTRQRRWWDGLFRLAMKSPWVCRVCGRRFYVKKTGAARS